MNFSSLTFILLFLPIFIFSYYGIPSKFKNIILAFFSLALFLLNEPLYLLLFLSAFILTYLLAIFTDKADKKGLRLLLFILGVVFNAIALVLYFNQGIISENIFFLKNMSVPNYLLMFGASVFTIRNISYLLEVYKKDCKASKNILNVFCYTFFFVTLFAGPILSFNDYNDCFLQQNISERNLSDGIATFVKGLSKVVLLSGPSKLAYLQVFSFNPSYFTVLNAWVGVICFIFYFYFSLTGYCDMAKGVGLMIGISLPDNFDTPFSARSVSEFISRFNISLTKWIKQFVLSALTSIKVRWLSVAVSAFTLCIIFGLFYKINLTVLVFGVYIGLFYTLERLFLRKLLYKLPKTIRFLYCFLVLSVGFVFLASNSLPQALSYIFYMFGAGKLTLFTIEKNGLYMLLSNLPLILVCILGLTSVPKKVCEKIKEKVPSLYNLLVFLAQAVFLVLCLCFIAV